MSYERDLEPHVRDTLNADPFLKWKALREQFEKLVLEPLCRLMGNPDKRTTIVMVVDALDECEKEDDVKLIIHLLPQVKALSSVRIRIFITSWPKLPIWLGFKKITGAYQDMALHQIPKPVIKHDISIFLRSKLSRIRHEHNET